MTRLQPYQWHSNRNTLNRKIPFSPSITISVSVLLPLLLSLKHSVCYAPLKMRNVYTLPCACTAHTCSHCVGECICLWMLTRVCRELGQQSPPVMQQTHRLRLIQKNIYITKHIKWHYDFLMLHCLLICVHVETHVQHTVSIHSMKLILSELFPAYMLYNY